MKRVNTIEQKDAIAGLLFISPWLIGFVFIFGRSIVESIIYSFSSVEIGAFGMKTTAVGWENYLYALQKDPDFITRFTSAFTNMAYEVPIIMFYSLFIAIILNQNFRGRTFVRVLFFLPVIIASGVVIQVLKQNGMNTTMGGSESVYLFKATQLSEILTNASIDKGIVDSLTSVVNRIFDISWKSGIQILLYLGGLQTIPDSYYEVCSMEGATPWESFWKVTFPMISPFTIVCIVYTVIDSFTDYSNPVMALIYDKFSQMRMGYSAAAGWIYFVSVAIVIAIVLKLISSSIYYNES